MNRKSNAILLKRSRKSEFRATFEGYALYLDSYISIDLYRGVARFIGTSMLRCRQRMPLLRRLLLLLRDVAFELSDC